MRTPAFRFSAVFFAFALCSTTLLWAQSQGGIDWTKKVVKAKGVGAPNPSMPQAAARPAAIKAAKNIALRNALELIKGMSLNSKTTVANQMVQSDVVNTSINGFVQGFDFSKPKYFSDGTVEVEATMPIDGAKGLGQTLFGGQANLIGEKPTTTFKPSGAASTAFTGLIVDAKGKGVKPALMPKILDQNGKEIYGSAYVSREFAVKYGMCGYAKSIANAKENADRIGSNPGLVTCLKAGGPNKADLVISNADGASIQSATANLKFLEECRVIVVID